MTAYHEADPNFHGTDRDLDAGDVPPGGGGWRLRNDIFPDDLFTPGTRIDLFYTARWEESSSIFRDPPSPGTYEMEVLPSSMTADRTWNCVLYVDHANRGARSRSKGRSPASSASVPGTSRGPCGIVSMRRGEAEGSPRSGAPSLPSAEPRFSRPWPTGSSSGIPGPALWGRSRSRTRGSSPPGSPFPIRAPRGCTSPGTIWCRSPAGWGRPPDPSCPSSPDWEASSSDAGRFSTGTARMPRVSVAPGSHPCVVLDPVTGALVAAAGRAVTHRGQGSGCIPRSFDALGTVEVDQGTVAGDERYVGSLKSVDFASVAVDGGTDGLENPYRMVTDGVSVHWRRDVGPSCVASDPATAIEERLREVLTFFGYGNSPGTCGGPITVGIPGEEARGTTIPVALSTMSPNPLAGDEPGGSRSRSVRKAMWKLVVLDLQGRHVRRLVDGVAPAGENERNGTVGTTPAPRWKRGLFRPSPGGRGGTLDPGGGAGSPVAPGVPAGARPTAGARPAPAARRPAAPRGARPSPR